MRTDELRSMLHEHSDDVADRGSQQRLASVRQRVVRVRRRRASVAVGAVAAVAVAMVGVVLPGLDTPDRGPANAPQALAGHDVPETEVALGYTYEYVRGVEGDAARPLRLRLPASDEPRLVMWASSDDDSHLRLRITGRDGDVVRPAGDFESFELLPAHTSHRLVLRQDGAADGRIALAVFDLSEDPPAGVTKGGVTFREEVLDDRLLTAVIGDPGEAVVRTEMTVPDGEVRIREMCQGADVALDSGYMVTLSVAGRDSFSTTCDGRLHHDAGTGGIWLAEELRRRGFTPGEPVTLEVRLVRDDDEAEKPVGGTDAVLGIGAYVEGEDRTSFRAAGYDLPDRLEHDGHEWVRSFVGQSDRGQGVRNVSTGASDRPMLVVVAVDGLADGASVSLRVDGEERNTMRYDTGPGAGSWGPDTVLEPGRSHEATLRVKRGLTDETQVAVVLYELVH